MTQSANDCKMLNRPAIDEAVTQMLREAAPGRAEVAARRCQALEPAYWRALCPALTIEVSAPAASQTIDAARIDAAFRQADRDGYFRLDAAYPTSLVGSMLHAVESLRGEGWHPAFAFVFDEFWSVCRAPALIDVITKLLGPGFRQTSKTWCHYVTAARGAHGWGPHMDDAAGRRKLTVWIPLTDATVENGCMYVVPKSCVPADLTERWPSLETVTKQEAAALLQGARALPARVGSIVGWDMGVLHWGSTVQTAEIPRVSVSFDFISGAELPAEGERPLLPLNALPAFSERLISISRNILDYVRFEPTLVRHAELARLLLSDSRSVGTSILEHERRSRLDVAE